MSACVFIATFRQWFYIRPLSILERPRDLLSNHPLIRQLGHRINRLRKYKDTINQFPLQPRESVAAHPIFLNNYLIHPLSFRARFMFFVIFVVPAKKNCQSITPWPWGINPRSAQPALIAIYDYNSQGNPSIFMKVHSRPTRLSYLVSVVVLIFKTFHINSRRVDNNRSRQYFFMSFLLFNTGNPLLMLMYFLKLF